MGILGANVQEIRYSGLGNFKAFSALPKGQPPFPCIIYAYDQFVDWNGMRFAQRLGYNLPEMAAAFADQGYVCIIPVERFRKMDSLKSAVDYASELPFVDPKRIYLLGMSEGGFMVLMAMKSLPNISAAVVINPRPPDDKGYFSVGTMLEDSEEIKAPILFYMSHADITRTRSESLQLFHGLRSRGVKVRYLDKNVGYKWFWHPSQEYVSDILGFYKK